MITSMAFIISTTTVTGVPTPTAPTISPTEVRGSTRVLLTITVGNASGAADNIENVLIRNINFDEEIGGIAAAENLKLAADNMENAVAPLDRAGENLKLAADNKDDAGTALISAATNLQEAANALNLLAPGWETNVASQIGDAAIYLTNAGDNMAADSENFTLIAELLDNAASKLHSAAGSAGAPGENMGNENYDPAASENLDNAAARLEDAASALRSGSLRRAGDNLVIAGDNFENASTTLSTTASTTVGLKMSAVGTSLKTAGQALQDAADYENAAGYNLEIVENYLLSAGSLIELADTTDLKAAGDNLENAAAQIGFAADNMQATNDNILQAGDNLSQAATYLANAATQLGAALGGDELEDAMEHENAAAENLQVGSVGLDTAGDQLIAAAVDLSAAADKLLETANALAPVGWILTGDLPNAKDANFGAVNTDNEIAPGGSKSFAFLWKTPSPSIDNNYTIQIWVYGSDWVNAGTVTLAVDDKDPSLTVVVTQTGVTENNLVGTVYDNVATVTITASEELSKLGTVYIDNGTDGENLLPALSMENTNNTVFTATFSVGAWDDNTPRVRVYGSGSATDLIGNENTNAATRSFTVDNRAPVLIENGLSAILTLMSSKVQAGTGTTYTYVDNDKSQTITVTAEDNLDSADNWQNLTVTVAGQTTAVTPDNKYRKLITLSEGLNSLVTVTATDRTGNSTSDNVENIFIDTQPPTIVINTVAGKTWDENGELINDNTPEIKITITDPGYPTNGLGVAYDNLYVYLNENDNINNINTTAPYGPLENKDPWVVSTGVFENVIDNAGEGLLDGTYWIIVRANDNLAHGGDNENWAIAKRSFKIDTVKPVKDVGIVVSDKIGGTVDNPNVYKTATRTIEGTVLSTEVGGTIKVYFNGVHQSTYDTTTTATIWSITVTLPAGQTTKIQFTLTDKAGNESDRVLYGYAMPDATTPTVTITTPESGISTDATSIILEATVTKDTWEEYSELTVRIDATSLTAPITATNVLSATGTLTRAVELVEGTNTISVSAQDVAGNWSTVKTVTVTRTVTPWATYAIIIVIVALILAAIAIFRKR